VPVFYTESRANTSVPGLSYISLFLLVQRFNVRFVHGPDQDHLAERDVIEVRRYVIYVLLQGRYVKLVLLETVQPVEHFQVPVRPVQGLPAVPDLHVTHADLVIPRAAHAHPDVALDDVTEVRGDADFLRDLGVLGEVVIDVGGELLQVARVRTLFVVVAHTSDTLYCRGRHGYAVFYLAEQANAGQLAALRYLKTGQVHRGASR